MHDGVVVKAPGAGGDQAITRLETLTKS